jgi:DNA-directed RNA polymerase specialized sigma subunit
VLHDADDAEKFCARILDDQLRAFGVRLRSHDQEDALSYLIGEAWRLSVRYDPSVGQRFSTYARRHLGLRFVDWLRAKLGRTRWSQSDRGRVDRPRREVLSLDGFVDEGGELVGGLRAGAVDPPRDRDPDLYRLLND